MKAYATTVYVKSNTGTHLIFSKNRIAPLKINSIPRMELLAVLIGVRSLKFVEKQLNLFQASQYLWTDSKCVLHWIESKKQLSTFVKNRIQEITAIGKNSLRYVNTEHNPADIATRGFSVAELQSLNLWFNGPEWINDQEEEWPMWDTHEISPEVLEKIASESKGTKTLFGMTILKRTKSHLTPLELNPESCALSRNQEIYLTKRENLQHKKFNKQRSYGLSMCKLRTMKYLTK